MCVLYLKSLKNVCIVLEIMDFVYTEFTTVWNNIFQ